MKYSRLTECSSPSAPKWAVSVHEGSVGGSEERDLEWKYAFQNILNWLISVELEQVWSLGTILSDDFYSWFL